MTNKIGKRGENIFSTIISRHVEPLGFALDPTFLGDKFPTVDFHVDLLNYQSKKGFFFASVKATTKGYNSSKTRINISLDKQEIEALSRFPVPVYLFGINEPTETGYFICANKLDNNKIVSEIPTKHKVNPENIIQLWKEVAAYWDNSSEITKFVSHFN